MDDVICLDDYTGCHHGARESRDGLGPDGIDVCAFVSLRLSDPHGPRARLVKGRSPR